jgi:hypothetical protein
VVSAGIAAVVDAGADVMLATGIASGVEGNSVRMKALVCVRVEAVDGPCRWVGTWRMVPSA